MHEMHILNPEKTDGIPPKAVLDMYRIDGYEDVSYEEYLRSRRILESKFTDFEQNEKRQNSLVETRNAILEQSEDDMASCIVGVLQNSNIEIQRVGASLIDRAPEHRREDLRKVAYEKIIEALNNPNVQIQRIAMNMVQFAPKDTQDQLREIVLEKIINAFNSDNVEVWRIMAKKIGIAPAGEQSNLREVVYRKAVDALGQGDLRIQRLGAVMAQYAPAIKQVELVSLIKEKFELAKENGLFKEIVESPLYLDADDRDSDFSKEVFSKTGSETTLLLGEQFRGNLILRHIEKASFLVWMDAYESHIDWSKAGFDYVPIEPIYSFHYDRNHRSVNVASGVLDLNLEEWYAFSGGAYKSDLDKQKNKILGVLMGLHMDHGHPNDSNFCLRFYRDKDGNIDINKIPRIYLIDFDKAIRQ